MSDEPPTPPAALPTDIVDTLNGYSPDQLQHVARYVEELAEHKAREARLEEESDENELDERSDDLPDDVPSKATITIKEINDNRYYYWQWREGDKIVHELFLAIELGATAEQIAETMPVHPTLPESSTSAAGGVHRPS